MNDKTIFPIFLASLFLFLLLSCSSTDEHDRAELVAEVPFLHIPPLLDTAKGKVTLRAQKGEHQIIPGIFSSSMGYNGWFLGPAILLHKGKQAQIEVVNELGEGTTLHSHGAIIPGSADGGPSKIIEAGTSWLLEFTVDQPAATLWFHPHKMGSTAAQVWQGLAGLYIVSDRDIENLPLPKDYGRDDIPIVIQERYLDDHGEMLPYEDVASNHMAVMNGVGGNAILINGQLQPKLDAASGWLRLRLLNSSNASSYRFSFYNQQQKKPINFYRIATEQGLLNKPEKRMHLDLATGSRTEVMLELPKQADTIQLELALWDRNLDAPSRNRYPVMNIEVNPKQTAKGQLPEILHDSDGSEQQQRMIELQTIANQLAEASEQKTTQRNFELQMMNGSMMSRDGASPYSINGDAFQANAINFDVSKGRYEVWRFTTDMLGHPVHIHGVQFRILKSAWQPQGSSGWHDTFTIQTEGEAIVLLRFPENADEENPYMLHCHMLEHEEAGMMAAFTVS